MRNGQRVLRLMTAAASSRPMPQIGIKRLQRQLAWLPAYDRRDVLTVKYVLDYMAVQFAENVEDEDEDPFAVVPELDQLRAHAPRSTRGSRARAPTPRHAAHAARHAARCSPPPRAAQAGC